MPWGMEVCRVKNNFSKKQENQNHTSNFILRKEDKIMAKHKSEVDYKWEKESTTRVNLKILNSKGIIQALDEYIKQNGQSRNAVCISALVAFL